MAELILREERMNELESFDRDKELDLDQTKDPERFFRDGSQLELDDKT
jgi:hypothetical protein